MHLTDLYSIDFSNLNLNQLIRSLNALITTKIEKIGPLRSWNGLQFTISPTAEAMFHAATDCSVGNGELTLFWYDSWLGGRSAVTIAPELINFIRPASALRMTVAQALQNNQWINTITGALMVPSIVQFMELWQAISTAPPLTSEVDTFRWKLTANGCYTARSAYIAYFRGSTEADYAENLWSSWAPLKEKLFFWLALRNRW